MLEQTPPSSLSETHNFPQTGFPSFPLSINVRVSSALNNLQVNIKLVIFVSLEASDGISANLYCPITFCHRNLPELLICLIIDRFLTFLIIVISDIAHSCRKCVSLCLSVAPFPYPPSLLGSMILLHFSGPSFSSVFITSLCTRSPLSVFLSVIAVVLSFCLSVQLQCKHRSAHTSLSLVSPLSKCCERPAFESSSCLLL